MLVAEVVEGGGGGFCGGAVAAVVVGDVSCVDEVVGVGEVSGLDCL